MMDEHLPLMHSHDHSQAVNHVPLSMHDFNDTRRQLHTKLVSQLAVIRAKLNPTEDEILNRILADYARLTRLDIIASQLYAEGYQT